MRLFSLEDISLCDGLESIGDNAFSGCGVKKLDLPDSIMHIGKEAFMDCDLLESVKMPLELRKIEVQTFRGCDSLCKIEMPKALESIGVRAFENTALVSLVIPRSVCEIAYCAFEGCGRLESVSFENTESWFKGRYSEIDGRLEPCLIKRGEAAARTLKAHNVSFWCAKTDNMEK